MTPPEESLGEKGPTTNQDLDPSRSRDGRVSLITPRRIAMKISSQTIVLEYKEPESGKLRHRSFRIDKARFESAEECKKKLWRRLSKAVVPNSLKEEQVHRMVSALFTSAKSTESAGDFDDDDLEAAADRLLAKQVEMPAPTMPAHSKQDARPAAATNQEEEEGSKPSSASLGSLAGLPSLKGKGSGGLLKPLQPLGRELGGDHDNSDENKEDGKSGAKGLGGGQQQVGRLAEPAGKQAEEEEMEEEIEYASDFEDIDVEESPKLDKEKPPMSHDPEKEEDEAMDEDKRREILTKIRAGEIDLQKVPQEDLAMYKELMDVEFKRNAIKPGDEGYEHDVQVEFSEAEEDAGWDEDDDYVPSDDDF